MSKAKTGTRRVCGYGFECDVVSETLEAKGRLWAHAAATGGSWGEGGTRVRELKGDRVTSVVRAMERVEKENRGHAR
jgi:hypothetical protein